MNNYYIYMLTNPAHTVLYVGVTSNLEKRIYEHKNKLIKGFTSQYNLNKLVYYEGTNNVESAIEREKQLKKWRRDKKEYLIKQINPGWKDLSLNF